MTVDRRVALKGALAFVPEPNVLLHIAIAALLMPASLMVISRKSETLGFFRITASASHVAKVNCGMGLR